MGCIAEAGHIERELWFLKVTIVPTVTSKVAGEYPASLYTITAVAADVAVAVSDVCDTVLEDT